MRQACIHRRHLRCSGSVTAIHSQGAYTGAGEKGRKLQPVPLALLLLHLSLFPGEVSRIRRRGAQQRTEMAGKESELCESLIIWVRARGRDCDVMCEWGAWGVCNPPMKGLEGDWRGEVM